MTWAAIRADAPPAIQTPAMPASGAPVANANGVSVSVYLTAGLAAITAVVVNGIAIAGFSVGAGLLGPPVRLSAGSTITLTYTGSPTWQWLP